jgi:hypothetical protein
MRVGLGVAAVGLALLGGHAAWAAHGRAADTCTPPSTRPLWIDYGESSVQLDTRAVLARAGVTVATSGAAAAKYFRDRGASLAYFELNLARRVGQPTAPADAATILSSADALYAKAVSDTGCATPWIGLNELTGAATATPWSPEYAAYRANILTLLQQLAARGAHPALLLSEQPNVTGDAALWWRTAAQSADLVYEAYYDAPEILALGPVLGNRSVRLGMRRVVAELGQAGVSTTRVGLMLGFHSAPRPVVGGRQGLQPLQAWLRVVKWETLAAKQVATETGASSIWSWGWGTFGPESVDADKPAAACTYLVVRGTLDPGACAAIAPPGFDSAASEGQIVLSAGVRCSFAGGRVADGAVTGLMRLTRDGGTALTAAFDRAALATFARTTERRVLAVERRTVAGRFHGARAAYLRALAARGTTLAGARAAIGDELRVRAVGPAVASARMTRLLATAICRGDVLPPGEAPAVSRVRLDRGLERREPHDERVDEVSLQQHRVRPGLVHRAVQLGGAVAGEGDQAEVRMVAAQAGDRGDTVEQRHVQVDDDGVGMQLVGQLDSGEPVVGRADHGQLRLLLDQRPQRLDEGDVVVRQQNSNRCRRLIGLVHDSKLALRR